MKHTHKVKLGRKMRTPQEEKDGVSIFDSSEWNKRKLAIAKRTTKK